MRIPLSYKKIVERWTQIALSYSESDLEKDLIEPMFSALGFNFQQIKATPLIGAGLRPDMLIYKELDQPPVLVVENKKRVPELAQTSEQEFAEVCRQHTLYRSAVGYEDNGIRQYLNRDRVRPEYLSSFGLVFNGDFFQLWQRVDGLVFPLTPIQKVTAKSLPLLMNQILYCFKNPLPALVVASWNQKGGVAKTTNTINIGASLAIAGKRVLLIDLDPQTDLTRGVGLNPNQFSGYLDPCLDKLQLNEFDQAKDILRSVIQVRKFPTTDKRGCTFSVLPGEEKTLKQFRDKPDVEPEPLFKKLLSVLLTDYDYILVDISPTPDKLTRCVLLACDAVVIPVDYGRKSLHHGVHLYQTTIPKFREIRAKNPLDYRPWNLGLVFSNCPPDTSSQLDDFIQQELSGRNFTGKQCKTRLRTYAQAKLAEFKHAPVVCWQSSPITKLYTQLVDELFLSHNFIDD